MWWYETPINIYKYGSTVSSYYSCTKGPVQHLKVWVAALKVQELLGIVSKGLKISCYHQHKSSGQQPKLVVKTLCIEIGKYVFYVHSGINKALIGVSVHLLNSPQASHSITVFFRKTISFIWKTQAIIWWILLVTQNTDPDELCASCVNL